MQTNSIVVVLYSYTKYFNNRIKTQSMRTCLKRIVIERISLRLNFHVFEEADVATMGWMPYVSPRSLISFVLQPLCVLSPQPSWPSFGVSTRELGLQSCPSRGPCYVQLCNV